MDKSITTFDTTIILPSIFSVAYTAEEVQYNWLSGSDPVGLEGDLQMSQFDLQKTFARELNFTRHESGILSKNNRLMR